MTNVIQMPVKNVENDETFAPTTMQIRAHIQHLMPVFCAENSELDYYEVEAAFVGFYHEHSGLEIDDVVDALDLTGADDFTNKATYRAFNEIRKSQKGNKIRDCKSYIKFAKLLSDRADELEGELKEAFLSDVNGAIDCAEVAEWFYTIAKKHAVGSVRSDLYEGMGDAKMSYTHEWVFDAMRKLGDLSEAYNEGVCICGECSYSEYVCEECETQH